MNGINTSLEDFEWGDPAANLFDEMQDNTEDTGLTASTVIKQLEDEEEDEEEEVEAKPQTKKTPKVEKSMFDEHEEQEEQDEEEEEEDEEKSDSIKNPNLFLLNKLKEKELIDFELEEDAELTDEEAEDLLIDKFDESVDNKVKQLIEDQPEANQQVIQFLLKGGNLSQFVNAMYAGNSDIDIEADLDKEANQISEMRKLLSLEDKDDEEIETEIEFLKDSGKLKAMVEKKMAKFAEQHEKRKTEMLAKQAEAIEANKRAVREAKAKVATFLNDNTEVDGITFTKEDKKLLPSFMNEKSVKLQNGTTITEMQKILFYDLPQNEKAHMQLATLLRNRNEDGTFNFDSLKAKAETKVTQGVRDNLRRNKTSIPVNSKNKSTKSPKSLADYFNK